MGSKQHGRPPSRWMSNSPYGLGISETEDEESTTILGSRTDWTPIVVSQRLPEQQSSRSQPQSTATPVMSSLSGSTQYSEVFGTSDTSYKGDEEDLKRKTSSILSANSCLASLHSISEKHALSGHATPHPAGCAACGSPASSSHSRVCSGARNFRRSMWSWPGAGIILMSLLATFLSGVFFFLGATGPSYKSIGTNGALTASSSAFLTTVIAKLIESMTAVLVATIVGQALARKAYALHEDRGINLAQITMRGWATQPGTIFSHWSTVRYAVTSALGLMTLIAAFMVLLYTSAATALVQPQLKYAKAEHRLMQSSVYTQFANSYYVQQKCKTPITHLIDHHPEEISKSCIQIEHASQAYHNYQSWLAHWTDVAFVGNGTKTLDTRPPGWALLTDNVTITAPWIDRDVTNAADLFSETGWIINNVTMAMPHAGVVSAAVDPRNGILQPDQLDGLGIYTIRASVPVPYVNAMCVMGMSETDLDPVMDDTAGDSFEGTGTIMDDIFHWGPRWGAQKWPPVFSRKSLPVEHNSIVNDTANLPYGREAIYVLGRGGDVDQSGMPTTANFALCSLQVGQSPDCVTEYTVSGRGGSLKADCTKDDTLTYSTVHPDSLSGNDTLSKDWVNIGAEWAKSISLNDGVVSGNSSNVRVWTQLFLSNSSVDSVTGEPALSMSLPSPAEALAVLSGCTLIESAQDSPFVQFWNYSSPILAEPGQTQFFNASIQAQRYASGGTAEYQKGFLVVLLLVLILNIFILVYLLRHRHWYLDLGDPANLFPLAAASPPTKQSVESSCELGTSEEHFKQFWKLRTTEGGHLYLLSATENPSSEVDRGRKHTLKRGFLAGMRSLVDMLERLRRD